MSDSLWDFIALVIAIAVPLAAGGLGAIPTASAIPTWYRGLKKPPWNPPDWIFAPTWTALYVLMGVAAWLVLRVGWDNPSVVLALILFAAQLILNVLWSWIFFGLRSTGWALAEIVVLWIAVLVTLIQFYSLSAAAGLLLVPYLLWVTFATLLNATVRRLNR